MIKYLYTFIITIAFLTLGISSKAQNINGVVNTYAKVTNISGNQFTIGTPAGRPGASLSHFNAGRKVLIYQAKGASINTSNTNSFGSITSLGNAGKYEIATVTSRSGSVISFSNLINTYDVNGLVQLVYIPEYTNPNVNATLTSTAWNASNGYGGIVILEASRLTLQADISVDGQGFRGGARSSNNGNGCTTVYRTSSTIYGEKGEGITTYSSNLRGQGPLANGGGGGSTHNGGGGGGSNHGLGSQGGIGWNCNPASSYAGGTAGRAMTYTQNTRRLFFGGGGGGGQQNNSVGTDGGNGGGIVILLVNELTTNCSSTHSISARGESIGDAGNDGSGGGGAGGVILINTAEYDPQACNIELNVDGGDGGDVNSGNIHGGGGGGGSGLIYSSISFPSGIIISGDNGADGEDNTGGSHSGDTGTDEPVDIVLEPEVPGAGPINGPGGLTAGLKVWFKANQADLYTNANLSNPVSSNGQEIKSWKNHADDANYLNVQGANSNTTYESATGSQLNFNDITRLSNVNRQLRTVNDVTAQTIVVVTKTNISTYLAGLTGLDGDRGIRLSNDDNIWRSSGSNDWPNGGDGAINGDPGYTHNKEWHIVYQEKGSSWNDQFFVGGYYSGRPYSGDIAEVIAYEDRLSNSEQMRVESYLALKYGITLPNDNYYNSSNNTIWPRSSYSAYHNDLAGIGRDNASALNQVKSKSINADAVVTIEAEGTIPNKSFLIWGNNNTALTDRNTSDIPNDWGERLGRIWRVRKTDNPGTVKITFDLTALGITDPKAEDFAILYDSNTTLNNATVHTAGRSLNVADNEISFTGFDLSTGWYFTLVTKKKAAPGGDIANLEFWLKADAGTGSTTHGGTVTPWEDQLESNDAKQSGSIALPIYRTNQLNFNPVMDYSGSSNRVYTISNSGDINTINNTLEKSFSIVFTTGTDVTARQVLYEEGGTARGVNAYIANSKLYVGAWNRVNDGTGSNWGFYSENITIAANTTYILTFNMQGNDGRTGKLELISAGKVEETNNQIGRLYAHGGLIGVGGMLNDSYFEPTADAESGNNYYFKGEFAEIIYSKEYLDAARRNRIESYLALKYGITLDQSAAQNYTSSGGSVVWSGSANSAYKTDIAGIARDDNTVLNQRKSKSVNTGAVLTISNGTSIATPANFTSDNAYLVWGHNGQAANATSGDYLGKTNNGIARIWRVSESGTLGDVRISINSSDLPSDLTTLLVSTDPTFPNTAATRKITLSVGATHEATVDFANGEYFTLAKSNTAPVLANLETSALDYCDGDETVSSAITVSDDDGDMLTATITIATGYVNGQDQLLYTAGSGVTVVSASNQTLELRANAANLQTALRAIEYRNTASGSSRTLGDRTISFIVNDGTDNSIQMSRTIGVSINPEPVGVFFD